MIGQAAFALRGRNPDVLTCIANLSNDEVFTPPEFANRMLDTLAEAWARDHGGASLWADPSVRFLDPCTDLFLAVTGLTVKDFHLLVRLKVFNTEQMNQAVFAFRRYEDASLRYTGIDSHPGLTHVGLYDTVVARE